ncbi:class I adenylate-forming enzyme family protein [Enterovirga aerilata]|uniref:Acyl--CoA ligase n=1 Tax=Enterovirga aerilata TaxID=2730920 RepID=A0A849I8K6_9HYPH|nr:class I adenylate-forming enzyme family protein [Enterovirga sp. DB1703]NNM74124.1 acyl--CoA ligase [Enterovirga sp. DB1703]
MPKSDSLSTMRLESHYGDRVAPCLADRPASFFAFFQDAVRRNPDGEALVAGPDRLTWRDLDRLSGLIAAGLAARGVRKGCRVTMLLSNRKEFVLTLLAAVRLGAITVPLNIREQRPAIAYLAERIAPTVIVHEASLAHILPEPTGSAPNFVRVAVGPCEGSFPFEALLEAGPAPAPADVGEEDTLFIVPTSGTTGLPKAPMLSHMSVIHSGIVFADALGLRAGDRSVVAIPMSHTSGIISTFASFVRVAGTIILLPEFKAPSFLATASAERMTHTLMVPAMYDLCLRNPDLASFDLSSWRIGLYGAALMPSSTLVALAQTFPSLSLMNAYGTTEAGGPATLMRPEETASYRESVGRAIAGVELAVMDDTGRELPPGETGELWIKGPAVGHGFWRDAEATAREYTGGWCHTGDIVRMDAEGRVYLVDRKKDMLNRGGFKIASLEVENALHEHSAVIECAIVGRPVEVLGERVHAFVRLAQPVAEDELKAFCRARLADYKVPESFTFTTDPLPRNAGGKVLKRLLRERM